MSPEDGPRDLERRELEPAAVVLADAFDEDPLYTRVFPPANRHSYLVGLWTGVLRYTRLNGLVLTTPAVEGVAGWLAPGRMRITFGRTLLSGFALPRELMRFPRSVRRQTRSYLAALDRVERQLIGDRPCWYLWVLGVDPAAQGRGIGRSLLRPVMERADREGLPCYLETFNEADLDFYERTGFQVIHEDRLPDNGLPLWALMREPLPIDA